MKSEETFKFLYFMVISCWISLAVIFGFTDLQISMVLVNKNSVWANIGKYYGEAPGYGIIAVSIAILLGSRKDDLHQQRIASYIILIIGLTFLSVALIFTIVWFIAFGGGITIAMLIFLITTKNKDFKEYTSIATIIFYLAIINPLLFVQITKILCGRVRFNNLTPGFINYTPWFLPPGPLSGIKGNFSFPSGHTAMGWMFLPLLITVKDRKWKDPVRILITIIIIGFGFFLGISRIVTGDHFASDVLFSTGMAALATIWLYQKFYIEKA